MDSASSFDPAQCCLPDHACNAPLKTARTLDPLYAISIAFEDYPDYFFLAVDSNAVRVVIQRKSP